MKNKNAFTLVELSVVIVIISVMLSTVMISRSLIDMAKINKIQEEARAFNMNVGIFFNTYNCLPGDCTAKQIPDLVAGGLNPACIVDMPFVACAVATGCPTATPLNTGGVETTTKRTCMMHSLQIAGYINGVEKTYTPLTDSIAGKNIPIAKFSRDASWDLRKFAGVSSQGLQVKELVSGLTDVPSEFTGLYNSLPNGGWANKNVLLLLGNHKITGVTTDIGTFLGQDTSTGPKYGISARLSGKLDLKFDDGKPYSGNIMSGLNYTDIMVNINVSGVSCNTINTDVPGIQLYDGWNSSNETYLKSNNIANGCLVGFVMNDYN